MNPTTFEFRRLTSDMEPQLFDFFCRIVAEGDDSFFHPHPFTQEMSRNIAGYMGKDQYVVIVLNGSIIGYGMLRGWDEGFDVPSLGMIVDKSFRGKGLGKTFMRSKTEHHGISRG